MELLGSRPEKRGQEGGKGYHQRGVGVRTGSGGALVLVGASPFLS